ncbi:hypothetical protein AB205_0054990 [Aquarana catesbeiana]|uniref:Uncharacterized protein n=1 Tax=Aquarana catesbeiana TaxID=8400 RepID=A0A2G9S4L6_AQUCT|nr:hypothetical protein AB205_0054990 [Aquarana catesbeiana]
MRSEGPEKVRRIAPELVGTEDSRTHDIITALATHSVGATYQKKRRGENVSSLSGDQDVMQTLHSKVRFLFFKNSKHTYLHCAACFAQSGPEWRFLGSPGGSPSSSPSQITPPGEVLSQGVTFRARSRVLHSASIHAECRTRPRPPRHWI